jgi:hypothetical protein
MRLLFAIFGLLLCLIALARCGRAAGDQRLGSHSFSDVEREIAIEKIQTE